jgi:tetratricopeptide (TPR) repeat protein
VGTFLATRGDYGEAADAFRNALDINDNDHRVWGSYAEALTQDGQPTAARDAYAAAVERAQAQLEMNPGNEATMVYLANYQIARSDTTAARSVVETLTQEPLENPSNVFSVGQILASLGETDQAYAYFERAVNRGYRIGPARRYPRLKHLWDQPRFTALVERSRTQ